MGLLPSSISISRLVSCQTIEDMLNCFKNICLILTILIQRITHALPLPILLVLVSEAEINHKQYNNNNKKKKKKNKKNNNNILYSLIKIKI